MPNLKKIRVLIVDDSLFFLKTLERGLAADSQIEVVGMAYDVAEANEKIETLKPDVVTLDVEMPGMNGIEFLKKLIPTNPIPVIVVSSLPIRVLDALDVGAVDFVKKPAAGAPAEVKSFMSELIVKIKIASVARVRNAVVNLSAGIAPAILKSSDALARTVIAIGASTGGTEAILAMVKDLPPTTPGIVVVQHMPSGFTNMYAQRLNRLCKMRVTEATDRERVETGKIIIGAGEYHLRLSRDGNGYYVRSEPGEKVSGHCPSVDVLFDSVASVAREKAIGVLLTGMGADGAKGLLKMKEAGAYTIGQDKESCVVYGMPQVAYSLGAVGRQLPLDQIGPEIIRYLNQPQKMA